MQRLPLELLEELLLYLPGYKLLFSYLDNRFPLPEMGAEYDYKVEKLCLAGNLEHALYVIEKKYVEMSRVYTALYDSGNPECMEYARRKHSNVKKCLSAAASSEEYIASTDAAMPKIGNVIRVNNFELLKHLLPKVASFDISYVFYDTLRVRRWHMAEYIVEHHRRSLQICYNFAEHVKPKARHVSRILDILLRISPLEEIVKYITNSHILLEACRRGCEFEHEVLHHISPDGKYIEVVRQLISIGIQFKECCFGYASRKHTLEFVKAVTEIQSNYLDLLLPHMFNKTLNEEISMWIFEESGISTREAVGIFLDNFRGNSDDLLSLLPLTDEDLDRIWQEGYTESFLYLYRGLPERRRRSYAAKWDTMKLLDFLALTRLTNYCCQ